MAGEPSGRARRGFYLHMLLRSVRRRWSRVLIAVLAIGIGATTLTGLASIVLDVPAQMGRELRAYGANLVVVPAGAASIPAASLAELDALVPASSVVGRAALRYETVRINEQPYTAAGADLDGLRAVRPYWQVDGSWPAGGQVLIGRDVADTTGLRAGSTVQLTLPGKDGDDVSTPAVVSGVLDSGDAEDAFVVLSRDDLDALFGGDRGADVVEYSLTLPADELTALAGRISADGPQVSASPVKRVAKAETTVLTTLNALLLAVTVIVLALAMITVGTTMMAVVSERRTEIGLKKALGADSRSIAADFLGEGVLLGALGGLLGGLLGLGFAHVVSLRVFGRAAGADWWLVAAAVGASVLVTVIACAYPVRRATDIEPAVVLRGE